MTAFAEKPKIEPFVISRVFDAPRGLVFKAFTDIERLKHWWGPKGSKVIASEMDLRPGGIFHYRPADAGWQHDVGPVRLSRDRSARADRLRQFILGRKGRA